MAIQNRRGNYSDFDPSKMVEGEIAVVKNGDPNTSDGTSIYVSTATGSAKRIALHQDIIQEVYDATEEAIPNYIDSSFTEPGMAADSKATGDRIGAAEEDVADLKVAYEQIEAEKADTDGTYPDMSVGMAEQLDSDNYTEDSEPYHFRKSGDGNVRVGDQEVDRIVGGTVAWNQLVNQLPSTQTIDGITFTNNNDGSISASGTATADVRLPVVTERSWVPHIFFISGCPKGGSASTFSLRMRGQGGDAIDVGNGVIWNASGNGWKACVIDIRNGVSIATAIKYVPQITDLTAAFGSTIADYIYSLEQSTAGAGVAFLRRYIDIDTYHPYDAGTLKSVEGLVSHDMVGFNQWDEEWEEGLIAVSTGQNTAGSGIRSKNFCRCVPGIAYFAQFGSGGSRYVFWYRADGSYIRNDSISSSTIITSPNDACFFRIRVDTITTYNHDICINLSDPAKNGTYEPYEKHSYPLDNTLTLRGVYKLSDGKLVADGDEYNADGTVTRRYGVVDLGTLNWEYHSATQQFRAELPQSPKAYTGSETPNAICTKYIAHSHAALSNGQMSIFYASVNGVNIKDSAYTDAATFKSAMSGVYLVYDLATPTAETADPFTNPQLVDGSGTEQYVSTSIVPIGHYTRYPEDLKSKIEGLPWDFASLIAPTEATYKATQNYTSGSLLIVNNILYKTTAAIANGGNITPGTNCTQTTLAAVIAAL